MNNILIIGLDGSSFKIINRFIDKLPNLKKLIKNGVSADMNSTIPPLSPAAWTSFSTGKNPGKHGIFDFEKPGNYESGIVSSLDVKEKRFWEILNEHGLTTAIFNMPVTYPPKKVKGYLVAGMLTPSENSDYTYPKDFKKVLKKLGYRLKQKEKYLPGEEEAVFKDLYSLVENKERVICELLKKHKCNVNLFVFMETDSIHHRFWKFMDEDYPCEEGLREKHKDKIFRLYKRIDKAIGKFIEIAKPDYTIIMSDHGAGPLYDTFLLNKWLMELGLLKMKNSFKTKIKIFLAKHNVFFRAYKFISKLKLKNVFLWIPREKKKFFINTFLSMQDIDWKRTKAYSKSKYKQIYLNLKGREKGGIVDKEEYERLRNFLIKKIKELNYKGKKMKIEVYKKEEIYHGKNLKSAPDITFVLNDYEILSANHFGFEAKSLFAGLDYANNSGTHRKKGLLIISGKGIKKRNKIKADLTDLAPTILFINGIKPPEDMDGRILKEIFEPKFYSKRKRELIETRIYDSVIEDIKI